MVSPWPLQVVRLASEPSGLSNMNLVSGMGSNIQVCYYSSTAAEKVEPQEADEMFVTVGCLVFSWETNPSLRETQLLFLLCIHTRLISSG